MASEVRDAKGLFQKGHPPFIAKGGHIGRPRTLRRDIKDALSIAQDAMPEIILSMIERTRNPDVPEGIRQAASEYLCDRIYGKANQPLSNADGSSLPVFTFVVPTNYTPRPGGLFSGDNGSQTNQKN